MKLPWKVTDPNSKEEGDDLYNLKIGPTKV